MEKPTKGSDYRAKRRKLITCPSEDSFIIRKPSGKVLTKVMDIFGDEGTPENMDTESLQDAVKQLGQEDMINFIDALLYACTVKPKIVDFDTDSDDEVWMDDVDPGDYFFLFVEILDFADMGPGGMNDLAFLEQRLGRLPGGDNSAASAPKA